MYLSLFSNGVSLGSVKLIRNRAGQWPMIAVKTAFRHRKAWSRSWPQELSVIWLTLA